MLGFKDTSTLVGHFVSCRSEREKEIEEIVEEMKERDREEIGIMNEREETEEIKTIPSTFTCSKDKPCPTVSQYQLNAPVT